MYFERVAMNCHLFLYFLHLFIYRHICIYVLYIAICEWIDLLDLLVRLNWMPKQFDLFKLLYLDYPFNLVGDPGKGEILWFAQNSVYVGFKGHALCPYAEREMLCFKSTAKQSSANIYNNFIGCINMNDAYTWCDQGVYLTWTGIDVYSMQNFKIEQMFYL